MARQKITPYFFGDVTNGRFQLERREMFLDWVRGLPDGRYKLSLQEAFKPRTTGQDDEETNWNGYYWGVIIEMLYEEMGLTRKDCHEEMKLKFNPKGYEYINAQGDPVRRTVGGTTRYMSEKRFIEYCHDIRRWAMDPESGLNFYIPEPHESPEAYQALQEAYEDFKPG